MKSTWRRVREVFDRAIDLPADERLDFIRRECVHDGSVGDAVARLLAQDAASNEDFLSRCDTLVEQGVQIEGFTVLRVLGTGGMGTVYEALQQSPRRKVALKTMRFGLHSDESARRFRFEAEVLARLTHPGIAQVHEVGTWRRAGLDHPYFAMELIEGAVDILCYANERRLPLRGRLSLLAEACNAVHHGHQRGVIHRDLKPGNILVTPSGAPKLIDFGVAHELGGNDLTRTGQVLGTLQYMSPEQVYGGNQAIDARSDIYALGCILHELVVGRPPYSVDDCSFFEAARRICEEHPRFSNDVPTELQWILGKLLEKQPERRYASVSELEADLRRFLAHEPVSASPPSRTYRARKFARRHRKMLAATSMVLLAMSLGWWRSERARRREVQATHLAQREAERAWAMGGFYRSLLASVSPLERGSEVRVADVLAEAGRVQKERLGSAPEALAMMNAIIGGTYAQLRLHDESDRFLPSAVAYVRQNLSEGDPVSVFVHSEDVFRLFVQGEYALARDRGLKLEPRTIEAFGPDHDITLRLQGHLAELHVFTGQQDEAVRRFDRYIEHLQRAYGPFHPEVLGALGGRALAWTEQGEHERARVEFERILELCEERLPVGHFRTWNARMNLGAAYTRTGRLEEARRLFERGYVHASESLGVTNPLTVSFALNLILVLPRLGEPEQALARSEELLSHDVDPRDRVRLECARASSLIALGLLQEAEQACKRADAALSGLGSREPHFVDWIAQTRQRIASLR